MSHTNPADFKVDKISTNVHRHASRGVLFLGLVVVNAAAHYKKIPSSNSQIVRYCLPIPFPVSSASYS
jgi:hypothetical protein